MSSGSELVAHRPNAEAARADERHLRILLVEGRSLVADELRESLSATARATFEVVCESDLVGAASMIRGDHFDLLLMDPQLPGVERATALELASDLAHRLPVVVLTGTEAFDRAEEAALGRLSQCVEDANVAGKLLGAIRRARRLGTGVMTPVFCRLEGLAA